MSARAPKLLRRRARAEAETRAFVASIRRSAFCCDACAYTAADEADAAADHDTRPLPLSLVTLLVTP